MSSPCCPLVNKGTRVWSRENGDLTRPTKLLEGAHIYPVQCVIAGSVAEKAVLSARPHAFTSGSTGGYILALPDSCHPPVRSNQPSLKSRKSNKTHIHHSPWILTLIRLTPWILTPTRLTPWILTPIRLTPTRATST